MGERTPLFGWHRSHDARIVDFGGWDMPVVYSSINEEHLATRQAIGLFDISHMGRLFFDGEDALAFLQLVTTGRLATLEPGQARYGLVLDESAGTLDDVLVYRLKERYLMVVNAGNRQKLIPWFQRHLSGRAVTMHDQTTATAMIACQGPAAVSLASSYFKKDLDELARYRSKEISFNDQPAIISRTGYTGEDGIEIIVPRDLGERLWTELLEVGESAGIKPCGLGARDTLRLEAAMPLYGHELSEEIDPVQAGLGWAIRKGKAEFIGQLALAKRDPERPVRVGLAVEGRRIPREGYPVVDTNGSPVGRVTSGTFAPSLQRPIAMGFVVPQMAQPGQALGIMVRGQAVPAKVVELPFYQRS